MIGNHPVALISEPDFCFISPLFNARPGKFASPIQVRLEIGEIISAKKAVINI
jgi:hypothetical protein